MRRAIHFGNLSLAFTVGVLTFLCYGFFSTNRLLSVGLYFGNSPADFLLMSLLTYSVIGAVAGAGLWVFDSILIFFLGKDARFPSIWRGFALYQLSIVLLFFAAALILKIRLDWLLAIKRLPFVKLGTLASVGCFWVCLHLAFRTRLGFLLGDSIFSIFTRVIIPALIISYVIFFPGYIAPAAIATPPDDPPRVLFITIDTLRGDYLHCYGKHEIETPNIDFVASKGILFDQAYSQAPYTWPSIASFFTGTYTVRNEVRMNFWSMAEDIETLPSILTRNGIQTVGISDIGLADLGMEADYKEILERRRNLFEMQPLRRLLPMLETFSGWFRPGSYSSLPTTLTTDNWLRRNARKSGWFLWVHYYNDAPHSPYYSPEPYCSMYLPDGYSGNINGSVEQIMAMSKEHAEIQQSDIQALKALYMGEVTWIDAQIGVLLDRLKSTGVFEKTTIIINSDHGQMFGRDGNYAHGFYLYDELMKVPLIICSPEIPSYAKGTRIDDLVRLLDLFPTIGELFDLSSELPGKGDGKSLMNFIRKGDDPEFKAWSYGETLKYGNHDPSVSRESMAFGYCAVTKDGWKLIECPEKGLRYLFNTKTDSNENYNYINEKPDIAASLIDSVSACFDVEIDELIPSGAHDLSEDAAERLRALGYIQ